MPMAQYRTIDLGQRISALRAVGTALGAPTTIIPSQSASAGDQHSWKALAALESFKSLPVHLSSDYKSFTSHVNKLVALVP